MKRNLLRPFELDLRSLAVFRIGLGLVILYKAFFRMVHADMIFGVRGLYSLQIMSDFWGNIPHLPSIHLASDDVTFHFAVFAVEALTAIAFTLGWQTRAVTLLLFYFELSNNVAMYLNQDGADIYIGSALVWCCWLPLGRYLSLDSRRNLAPESNRICNWASAALVLQIVMIYWFAGHNKTGAAWKAGTAVQWALNLDLKSTIFAEYLRSFFALNRAATYLTPYFEMSAVLLLVPFAVARIRMVLICAFVIFHLAFGVVFHIGALSFAASCIWLALIPTEAWDRLWRKTRRDAAPALQPGARWRWACAPLLAVFFVAGWQRTPGPAKTWPVRSAALATMGAGLSQSWLFFAPNIPRYLGWYQIFGKKADGRWVEYLPFRDSESVNFRMTKPKDVFGETIGSEFWDKAIYRAFQYPKQARALKHFLCARYEEARIVHHYETMDANFNRSPGLSVIFSGCLEWKKWKG
jgi:hypothetical protein